MNRGHPNSLTLHMTLRGEAVEVDVHLLPPDREAGILGYGFEDEIIRDLQGNVLPWDLSDDEVDRIIDKIQDQI